MKIHEMNIVTGENSHQNARIEIDENIIDYDLSADLSFNELLFLSNGIGLISEFYDVKAACSISQNGICAVALGQTITDAVQKIMDSNPIDYMNSIIVLSSQADSEAAKFFKNTNIVAAPGFTKNALDYIEMHDIRYVKINTPLKDYKQYLSEEIKVTPLGTFIQSPNMSELDKESFKVVSKQKPTVEQIEDAVFAWKVAKHSRSQAIVIAKDLKTTAIAQGLQTAAIEFALDYSCDMSKDAILASDMPIQIHDTDVAAQGRIALIIVPEASPDVIKQADKYSMSLITTGITNIKY